MINRFSMRCRTNLTGVILLVATSWSLGVSAELPRSTLVDSAQSSDDGLIRVVLGGIENVPRGIVAENEILVEGVQSVNVFEAPPSMSHGAVRDALVANRVDRLQQQFSCDGRACGSSGDWANGVLVTGYCMDRSSISTIGLGATLAESTGNQFMWVGGVTGRFIT